MEIFRAKLEGGPKIAKKTRERLRKFYQIFVIVFHPRGGKSIGPRDHWSQKIFWLPEKERSHLRMCNVIC